MPNQHPPTRRMPQEEVKERAAGAFFWHCDEKWSKEHCCKQGKQLMIGSVADEPENEAVDPDHEITNNDDIDEPVTYIAHILASYFNPQTMKIEGVLKLD